MDATVRSVDVARASATVFVDVLKSKFKMIVNFRTNVVHNGTSFGQSCFPQARARAFPVKDGMRAHYQILLPLLSLFLVRVDLTDLYPITIPIQIIKVLDGDTVEVRHRHQRLRVRLSPIDAPEKNQKFFDSEESAGEFARSCLLDLKPENYKTLEVQGFDQYGRILGDIDELGFDLISHGCATLYPYAKFGSKKEKDRYLLAQTLAKRMRKGIWKSSGYVQPIQWRRFSRRFAHRP